METKTILITGGTGLVGTALSKLLTINGYKVIILSREPAKAASRHEKNDSMGNFFRKLSRGCCPIKIEERSYDQLVIIIDKNDSHRS